MSIQMLLCGGDTPTLPSGYLLYQNSSRWNYDLSQEGSSANRIGGNSLNQNLDSTTAYIEYQALRSGTLSFYLAVYSEPSWDKGRMIINGTTIYDISGTYTVSSSRSGIQSGDIIRFEYVKDGSVSVSPDTFYVTNLYIT